MTARPLQGAVAVSTLALLASTGTLICCVLPAVMVALGAGAVLAGVLTEVPALIWLSRHKALVFGTAATLIVVAGVFLWRARSAPCPADPALAAACARLRRGSVMLWGLAVLLASIGTTYAFVLPALRG